MTSKYDALYDHLADSGKALVKLSFPRIERIIGQTLPASARTHQAWWSNEESGTHSHARSWMDAGYRTRALDLNAQTVEFVRGGTR